MKILTAIPKIFSLRGNDYSDFVVKGGASEMMRKNWESVGHRLSGAITKVKHGAEELKKR